MEANGQVSAAKLDGIIAHGCATQSQRNNVGAKPLQAARSDLLKIISDPGGLCLTNPVRADIIFVVFKDSRGLRAINVLPRMQPILIVLRCFRLGMQSSVLCCVKRPQNGALPIS